MILKSNISLIDFCTSTYGSVSSCFTFIQANPQYNLEDILLAGDNINSINFISPPNTQFTPSVLTQKKPIIIQSQISIIDYVTENYGIEALFNFVQANGLTDIENNLNAGYIIIPVAPISLNSVISSNIPPAPIIIPQEGLYQQSVWDLALQASGDISNVFNVILRNPQLGTITNTNIAGISYIFPAQNNSTTSFFKNNNINLATNLEIIIPSLFKNRSHNISFSISFN